MSALAANQGVVYVQLKPTRTQFTWWVFKYPIPLDEQKNVIHLEGNKFIKHFEYYDDPDNKVRHGCVCFINAQTSRTASERVGIRKEFLFPGDKHVGVAKHEKWLGPYTYNERPTSGWKRNKGRDEYEKQHEQMLKRQEEKMKTLESQLQQALALVQAQGNMLITSPLATLTNAPGANTSLAPVSFIDGPREDTRPIVRVLPQST